MIKGTKRPRVKAIEITEPKSQKIDAQLNASIHNRFDITVVDAKSGLVKQKAIAENVICNKLWTKLLSSNGGEYFKYIHYGSGSGVPATTDTTLFSFIAAKSVLSKTVRNFNKQEAVYSEKKSISILETEAIGQTLTEVGIGYGTSASSLCTHAMIKDMNGNQISINKTDTDIINIHATIYIRFNTQNFDGGKIHILNDYMQTQSHDAYKSFVRFLAGSVTTSGVALYANYQTKMPLYIDSYVNYYNGPRPRLTTTMTFNLQKKRIVIKVPRIPATDFNLLGGIRYLSFWATDLYTVQDSPYGWYPEIIVECGGNGLPPTTITNEAIGTGDGATSNFATLFPLASNATVLVDGVVSSSVTIDEKSPLSNNILPIMKIEYDDTDMLFSHSDSPILVMNSKLVLYNPLYETGVKSFRLYNNYYGTVSVSNDKNSWTTLATPNDNYGETTDIPVPSELAHFKYWKVERTPEKDNKQKRYPGLTRIKPLADGLKNIHFSSPPQEGSIITANYTTPVVAKDTNHVFDFSMTVQLGEYTE